MNDDKIQKRLCPLCDAELKEGQLFCGECGANCYGGKTVFLILMAGFYLCNSLNIFLCRFRASRIADVKAAKTVRRWAGVCALVVLVHILLCVFDVYLEFSKDIFEIFYLVS